MPLYGWPKILNKVYRKSCVLPVFSHNEESRAKIFCIGRDQTCYIVIEFNDFPFFNALCFLNLFLSMFYMHPFDDIATY